MRFITRVLRRFSAVAVALLLAACSSSPSTSVVPPAALSPQSFDGAIPKYLRAMEASGRMQSAPAAKKSWLDRDAYNRLTATSSGSYGYAVFVSNADLRTVDIYQSNTYEPQNPNPPLIGQITVAGYAEGLAVDRNQNLYVIDYGHGIEEYTKASMPNIEKTYNDPYFPQGIAVGPDGTLYAGNTSADPNGNIGISVFPPNATTQSKLLTDPSFYYAFYPVVDIKGNVYLVYADKAHTNLGSFGEFPAGSSTFKPIALANNLYQAELDANGDLLAADPNTASIDTYPNGSNRPTASLVTESNSDFFLFDQTYARNQVFTEPFHSANGLTGGPVLQFTYPQGIQLDTIQHGTNYIFGIVTSPAAPLPQPYVPPVAGATPPIPTPTPTATQGPCQNSITGPLPDPSNDRLTFGGGTSCVGANANGEQISTTASLFNANDNEAVESFSFGVTGPTDAQKKTIACPGDGSYYVVVTSNVAPAVKSSTVTSSGC